MLDLYACNTSDLEDVYIFKILDLNISTSNIHQFQNALGRSHKWDPKGKGFITDGRGVCFSITALYETTKHTDSYCQVAFHKLSNIKFLKKNPDDATIVIVFNKFIYDLHEYEHAVRTPEALDERI